jgi:histidyl-tRNA synthetase
MITSIKGTKDILPPESGLWHCLESKARDIFSKYNYKEIRTPTIEQRALFIRSVGEDSDIVQKQMYAFTDQGGREICLRPEETAPVVRSYIENNLHKTEKFVKLFYIGSMYRSEKPQAGRQRQFQQVGVEVIGSDSVYADCEIIILLDDILRVMPVANYRFRINTLGCQNDKERFKRHLKGALKSQINRFCQDCQKRYNMNILRMLDCKNEACKNIFNSLKITNEHICAKCNADFKKILDIIKNAGITYEQDALLVRGLDYYTGVVFEVTSPELGAQDAIAAGGRYNNLVEELGGPATGACGFAIGFERLLSVIKKGAADYSPEPVSLFIVTINEDTQKAAFDIQRKLREKGISCDMDYQGKSLKAQMRYADKIKTRFVAVIGDDELKTGEVALKNMGTGEQKKIKFSQLSECLLSGNR